MMRAPLTTLWEATLAVRPVRLIAVVIAATLAGVAADFLRGDQRLVFPRPLPAFTTIAPTR